MPHDLNLGECSFEIVPLKSPMSVRSVESDGVMMMMTHLAILSNVLMDVEVGELITQEMKDDPKKLDRIIRRMKHAMYHPAPTEKKDAA